MSMPTTSLALFLLFAQPVAASPLEVPHQLDWIPYVSGEFLVTAALDVYNAPVVVYDPRGISEFPSEVVTFMLLREERIALMAEDLVRSKLVDRASAGRTKSTRNANSVGRFAIIEESVVYGHPDLAEASLSELESGARISCLVFRKLNEGERSSLMRRYKPLVESGHRFSFGSDEASRSPKSFERNMKRCIDSKA